MLPGTWAGQGSGVVEGIFSERALGARFVERHQTGDHFVGRRGLRERDGLLVGNTALVPEWNRDVQPNP